MMSTSKRELKDGMMIVTVVGVGKSKQKNMCCLNVTVIEKSE